MAGQTLAVVHLTLVGFQLTSVLVQLEGGSLSKKVKTVSMLRDECCGFVPEHMPEISGLHQLGINTCVKYGQSNNQQRENIQVPLSEGNMVIVWQSLEPVTS